MNPIKSAPYFNCRPATGESYLAAELRKKVIPAMRRRLPNHHLNGLSHDWAIKFIKKNRKKYPFFLRTDIKKFYPNIIHKDLIVGCQLAYRDLFRLSVVPETFKKKYFGAINDWVLNLPIEHKGIPLGSPFSALCAPLMLVPMWLRFNQQFNTPIAIYMDDILILAHTKDEIQEMYMWLHNHLVSCFNLELNLDKTNSGRLSRKKFTYCGYCFMGHHIIISESHIETFKGRIEEVIARSKHIDRPTFIKRINRNIDGFGNFYKHGDVRRQFGNLDVHIRTLVRAHLFGLKRVNNCGLSNLGLRSLVDILDRHIEKKADKKPNKILINLPRITPKIANVGDSQTLIALETLSSKLTEMIAIGRKQIKLLERLTDF